LPLSEGDYSLLTPLPIVPSAAVFAIVRGSRGSESGLNFERRGGALAACNPRSAKGESL
jgi:hypothetical protein